MRLKVQAPVIHLVLAYRLWAASVWRTSQRFVTGMMQDVERVCEYKCCRYIRYFDPKNSDRLLWNLHNLRAQLIMFEEQSSLFVLSFCSCKEKNSHQNLFTALAKIIQVPDRLHCLMWIWTKPLSQMAKSWDNFYVDGNVHMKGAWTWL
jgi:hypothetical protein